ncbi:MAG: DUF302 domain-containing protein [Betaproteobacteria bacterium]|nr:MAG: DUF302 domain-containing protein [Betaproteobacteria bacterium]TAG49223.1 MAG: DUF302 domain-containing protein [Betaproteobacteria bacterium]
MKSLTRIVAVAALLFTSVLSAQDGLVAVKSPMKTKATMDKFEAIVKDKGMNIVARVDHAAGAMKVGKTLRPTEVLIFGNPQGGTPLMECAQSVGIDLPLKALVWEDKDGQTWIGYNDPKYLAARHKTECTPVVENMTKAMNAFVQATVAP